MAGRLLGKAEGEAARQRWQLQADILHDLAVRAEGNLEEQQRRMDLCWAMVEEIEAELDEEKPYS